MSQYSFNAAEVEPSTGFDLIPSGTFSFLRIIAVIFKILVQRYTFYSTHKNCVKILIFSKLGLYFPLIFA